MRENIAVKSLSDSSRFPARASESIGAARTLSVAEVNAYNAMTFVCTTAGQDLNLPAEAACNGAVLLIACKSATALSITVKEDGGTTILTIPQNKSGIVWCNGTAWYGLLGA